MREPVPKELHPELAKLIREEIRAGFFMDPPTSRRDQPHDIELQRRVLASLIDGVVPVQWGSDDLFYGDIHKEILAQWRQNRCIDPPMHLLAEVETIAECPVMVGKPFRDACLRLDELHHRRECADHLRRALARIEADESHDLIYESINLARESL